MAGFESGPQNSRTTSTQLLARVRQNEQGAWNQLVSLYAPLIYRWCCQSGMQASDATDITQEVFRAVTANIQRFRRDRPSDSFRAWLRTITRNKVLDHVRRERARPVAVGGSDAKLAMQNLREELEPTDEADERLLLLRRAMGIVQDQFEPRTWQAFMLNAVEGRSAQQVAQELQMTVPSVWKAKSRVMQRLREQFGDVLEFE